MPLLFRGDSHLLGRTQLPLLRRLSLRFLYRQFAALTYVGAANHDYFRALGVPEEKLFFAPHSVNAEHFNPSEPATRAASEKLLSSTTFAKVIISVRCSRSVSSAVPYWATYCSQVETIIFYFW